MGRKSDIDEGNSRPEPAQPKSSQAKPTRPRPVSKDGRQLDQWGLPMGGPARAAAVEKAGKRDPRTHPEDWKPSASTGGTAE